MGGRRIIYLLSLAGCFVFFSAYQLWFSWFALVAVLLLPLFSLAISLPAMVTARLELGNPPALYLGTRQELVLLYGSRLMPTPPWRCKVTVNHPMSCHSQTMKDVEELPTDHCGQLICKIRRAWVYDYLGLIAIPMKRGPECRTLIRPTPMHPGQVPDPDTQRLTQWRPKRGGGFAENHELRLYRPGDNIQQIHWKLSAKTGQLILREPMEPLRGKLLVQMELTGHPAVVDDKMGKLLWVGQFLLDKELSFHIRCLTGSGLHTWTVTNTQQLQQAVDALLTCPRAQSGSLENIPEQAAWLYHIGGESDVP